MKPSVNALQSRPRPVLASLLLTGFLIAACQTFVEHQEAEHNAAVELNHVELIVDTSDLTVPYDKLGTLSYTEPVSGETIDTEHINEKLREMAIARWGQQVDAVFLSHQQDRRRPADDFCHR